jgi:hypothetical protein
MYKSSLRHIHDPVLSSLKMKGIVTGDSGSNPERAHGDKFLVCQLSKFATQQEM